MDAFEVYYQLKAAGMPEKQAMIIALRRRSNAKTKYVCTRKGWMKTTNSKRGVVVSKRGAVDERANSPMALKRARKMAKECSGERFFKKPNRTGGSVRVNGVLTGMGLNRGDAQRNRRTTWGIIIKR